MNKRVGQSYIDYFIILLITDAKRTNVALQALPLLFPAGCMKGKKGPKRATTDESCRSFIGREKVNLRGLNFLFFFFKQVDKFL